MNEIIQYFSELGDLLLSLVDFLISFLGDLVFFVRLIVALTANIPNFFSWLPVECVSLIVIVFAVVIVLRVLDR